MSRTIVSFAQPAAAAAKRESRSNERKENRIKEPIFFHRQQSIFIKWQNWTLPVILSRSVSFAVAALLQST
jgi:hypothetical protein